MYCFTKIPFHAYAVWVYNLLHQKLNKTKSFPDCAVQAGRFYVEGLYNSKMYITLKTHFLKNLKLRFYSCEIRIARHNDRWNMRCQNVWIAAVQDQEFLC